MSGSPPPVGVTEAEITFDKFHVMQLIGRAVDDTRRTERKVRSELKGSRYVWLKNEQNLRASAKESLASLTKLHLKAARAYQLRCAFQEIYARPTRLGRTHDGPVG